MKRANCQYKARKIRGKGGCGCKTPHVFDANDSQIFLHVVVPAAWASGDRRTYLNEADRIATEVFLHEKPGGIPYPGISLDQCAMF